MNRRSLLSLFALQLVAPEPVRAYSFIWGTPWTIRERMADALDRLLVAPDRTAIRSRDFVAVRSQGDGRFSAYLSLAAITADGEWFLSYTCPHLRGGFDFSGHDRHMDLLGSAELLPDGWRPPGLALDRYREIAA